MTGKRSLFERCQGPGAVAIAELVNRADERVAAMAEHYGDDFLTLADTIESAARAVFAGESTPAQRAELLATVQDITSSAATAGYKSVSAIASHLHDCLERHGLHDSGSARFVTLHVDAMRGAAKWRSADWSAVLEELRQAATVLGDKHKPDGAAP
jgi:hypothetical protein